MKPPFHIGQPVICADPRWGYGSLSHLVTCPIKGRIYHVRWIGQMVAEFDEGPTWWLRLEEIINKPLYHDVDEPVFEAKNYRALGERKSDISFAHAILAKATQRIDA